MRILAISTLALMALPASAQQVGMVGPRLAMGDVRAERFDAVFEYQVAEMPSVPVLWNQTANARWDAVVCNTTKDATGAVKAEESARWGYLDTNVCTMLTNVAKLDLSTVTADKPWTAKIYLRAHQ